MFTTIRPPNESQPFDGITGLYFLSGAVHDRLLNVWYVVFWILGGNIALKESVIAYMVNVKDEYEICFTVFNVRFILY